MGILRNIKFVLFLFLILARNAFCTLDAGLLDALDEARKSSLISSIKATENKEELTKLYNDAFNILSWNSKSQSSALETFGVGLSPEENQLNLVIDFCLAEEFPLATKKQFLSLFLPKMPFQSRQEIVDHLLYFKVQSPYIFITGIQNASEEIKYERNVNGRKIIIEKHLPCRGYMRRR